MGGQLRPTLPPRAARGYEMVSNSSQVQHGSGPPQLHWVTTPSIATQSGRNDSLCLTNSGGGTISLGIRTVSSLPGAFPRIEADTGLCPRRWLVGGAVGLGSWNSQDPVRISR